MFFMVGSDIYGLLQHRQKRQAKKLENLPFFTVVIPAYNEQNTVLYSLKSVINAEYPKDKLQIIVVDDGSKDATAAIVEEYCAANSLPNVQIVKQQNAGKAHALNNAMKNFATGELVMCLDADSSIEPDALRNAARYFTDSRVVALSANVKIRRTGSLFNLIQHFEYLISYQMKRAQTVFNVEYIIGGIGSTFRRSALEQVGYYDTDTITEDIDLTMKFIRNGNKANRVIYGSDVVAHTESVLDLAGLISQRYRWKYGRTQTFFKNPGMFFASDRKYGKLLTWFYLPFSIFSDIAFLFEPLMVSYIFYVIFRYGDIVTLVSAFVVVGTYISLNVLAEDTISWKDRIKLVLVAPAMYVCFYVLSVVEYMALIKGLINLRKIKTSITEGVCGWQHVERATVNAK